jgi:hypothetical protein
VVFQEVFSENYKYTVKHGVVVSDYIKDREEGVDVQNVGGGKTFYVVAEKSRKVGLSVFTLIVALTFMLSVTLSYIISNYSDFYRDYANEKAKASISELIDSVWTNR